MKTPYGYSCTEEEIFGSGISVEPDWTIYADCLDCPCIWRGEWGKDDTAVRFRVDAHVRDTGHRVKWSDAEQEFFKTEPVVIVAER